MLFPLFLFPNAVTFAAPTDTVARLLPKLGTAMGQRLVADRTAGQQVLLIRVQNMDRTRLLDLVADVTGGVWEETEGGGRRLTLGPRRLRELREAEAKRREKWIADERRKLKGPIAEALATVGDATLARIGLGERVVWSGRPNRLQRRLAKSEALENGIRQTERRRIEEIQRRAPEVMNFNEAIEAIQGPLTTLLVVRRGLDAAKLGVSLTTYGAEGSAIVRSSALFEPPLPSMVHPATNVAKRPVGVPDDVRAWTTRSIPGPVDPVLVNRVAASLRHPESQDPLAFAAGPALSSIAGSLGTDLVAHLPDSLYGTTQDAVFSSMNVEAWIRDSADQSVEGWLRGFAEQGIETRLEGGTLLVRPRDLPMAVERRADRKEIRKRIAALETHGRLPLAFPVAPPLAHDVVASLPVDRDGKGLAEEVLRFAEGWRSLPPSLREAALKGRTPVPPGSPFWTAARRLMEAPEQSEEPYVIRHWLQAEPTILFAGIERNNFVGATFAESPATVYQMARAPFPAARTNIEAAQALVQGRPGDLIFGATFYPAVQRKLKIEFGSGTYVVSSELVEITRGSGAGFRYPNLFPALREAVENFPKVH